MNALKRPFSRSTLFVVFFVPLMATVFHHSDSQAQESGDGVSGGALGQAFSVFSVDKTASQTDSVAQANDHTLVAGPFEFHRRTDRPLLRMPSWIDAVAGAKIPLSRKPGVKQNLMSRSRTSEMNVSGNRHVLAPANSRPASNQMVGYQDSHPRAATHSEYVTHADSGYESVADFDAGYVLGVPAPSHRVIRSPGQISMNDQPVDSATTPGGHSNLHRKADAIRERHRQTHPDHSSIRRRIQPEPPTIPGGRESETWKQPYSYGYFGASGERHWSMQHGYRDRYTQWTRR